MAGFFIFCIFSDSYVIYIENLSLFVLIKYPEKADKLKDMQIWSGLLPHSNITGY